MTRHDHSKTEVSLLHQPEKATKSTLRTCAASHKGEIDAHEKPTQNEFTGNIKANSAV